MKRLRFLVLLSTFLFSCVSKESFNCSSNEDCLELSVNLIKDGAYERNRSLIEQKIDSTKIFWLYVSGLNDIVLNRREPAISTFDKLRALMNSECGNTLNHLIQESYNGDEKFQKIMVAVMIDRLTLNLDSLCFDLAPNQGNVVELPMDSILGINTDSLLEEVQVPIIP